MIDWSIVASAHIFVDDKECIVCIPVTEKAWHVLYNTPTDNQWYNDANDVAFGVEGSYFLVVKNVLVSHQIIWHVYQLIYVTIGALITKQKYRDTKTFKPIKLILETYQRLADIHETLSIQINRLLNTSMVLSPHQVRNYQRKQTKADTFATKCG